MSTIDTQMKFEELRDSVESLVKSFASTRFRVVTEQKESSGAEEHKDLKRSIQIFYESGSFPDGTSSKRESTHEITFQIEYTATAAAKVDLNALNDPESTASDILTALAASQGAGFTANRSIDELRRMIYQIILDPVNSQLGMSELDKNGAEITDPLVCGAKQVSQVRLVNFRKNAPIARGKIFVLTASEQLTCQVTEITEGATPIAVAQPGIELNHEFNTKSDADDADPATFEIDVTTTE